jgi:hypothetical protein
MWNADGLMDRSSDRTHRSYCLPDWLSLLWQSKGKESSLSSSWIPGIFWSCQVQAQHLCERLYEPRQVSPDCRVLSTVQDLKIPPLQYILGSLSASWFLESLFVFFLTVFFKTKCPSSPQSPIWRGGEPGPPNRAVSSRSVRRLHPQFPGESILRPSALSFR